uniref:FIIND domain-containing protein n=1 Tax=Acanthochromis polyacanthus TaxID=80966 RepID=A0A3Q1EBH9_9TELE
MTNISDCGSSPCFCCSFGSRCSVSESYELREAKPEREQTERETSWFSRTARRIRRRLSRVQRHDSPPHIMRPTSPFSGFLAVAHVKDDGVEFISPHKITETHLVINIRGFSGFGNVKDEDSPPDPVRALVLLFYRPPDDPDVTSILNVLLLPKNVSLRDVQRTRKKLVGEERYIETSPHCKLLPDQVYTLSTAPEDDSVLVQPTEAEFEEDCYDNYFPTFQVFLETTMKHMKLFLRDSSSQSVWDRRVCLSSAGQIKSCGTNAPNKKLLDVRSSFIDGTSGPVLNSLLDKLLEKKVLTDSERESADVMPNRRDKARFIIDTHKLIEMMTSSNKISQIL